jgi:hypothetical protein
MSGPHMSDAARRVGTVRQRAVAAWPPRAASTPRFKAAVGIAHRASRQLASPAPPSLRQRPHSRRSPNCLVSLISTALSLSERHDRRCPAASAVVSTTTVSVARALLSLFFIRGVSSSPSPPSSPSQFHRRPP